ncbi:acetate--CoA ligase family protein [Croceicoccus sp. YJ47]|uniref:acetate--CoA ligase family protein n=1 Tax=Croceicoccus sp. YJ47 TaxID=2798724 RepID=UPI0019243417|nr:acetate--CoA ligase family protein [Croceicoccus sp. YJ47]QQN74401.1 acetate--CoA ligase family protein [Croceicoccus sp. YJ47]
MAKSLDALFAPRSIAFIGASNDPTRIGGRPLHYCLRDGFEGEIYPVNPSRDKVQGLKAFPSIGAIPADEVDLLVIAVPPKAIPMVLAEAGAKNVRAAVVLTSGFSETGEKGAALEAEMLATARKLGIRLLGPNCLGFYKAGDGIAATFSSLLEDGPPPQGELAIVSQSGAYGAHIAMLARRRGIGLASFAATGNECDIGVADLIEAAAADINVKVIGCYVEGIRHGRAFLRAVEVARLAGKPVILLKVGTSSSGQKAAQSHTASLAGDDRTLDQIIGRSGAIRVETTQELVDTLYVLTRRGLLASNRLGILTVSGGAGILMADAAEAAGFDIASMPEPARADLDARIPLGSSANPVDTTAQAMSDASIVRDAVSIVTRQGNYDAVVAFFMNWPESPVLGPPLREAIQQGLESGSEVPFAICMNAGPRTVSEYEETGLLVFEDPSFAVTALAHAATAGRAISGAPACVPTLPDTSTKCFVRLDEAEALAALADAGIPTMPFATARNSAEAGRISRQFDGPLAIKVISPDVQHKSDAGGVRLAVDPGNQAADAASKILADVGRAHPAAEIRGVLIAPMIRGVAELILGARIDPVFGPVVSVGMGGIFTELLDDVAIGLAPLDANEALELIRSLCGFPLLDGMRGKPRVDIRAAAETMAAMSRFIARHRGTILEVEINPLLLLEEHKGAVALDALIIPETAENPVIQNGQAAA